MLELNKIHQGDCMELMQHIPDRSVDMILCDLPYGTTACEWDKVLPLDELWKQYKRILKEYGVVVLTASQPFTTDLINSNREWFRYCWVWEKSIGANPLSCNKRPMKYHEDVLVFYNNLGTFNPQKTKGKMRDKKPKMYGCKKDENWGGAMRNIDGKRNINDLYYPRSVQYFSNADQSKKSHPTQKPVPLFRYLIKTYTNEGELVLDNCIGSGTTAVACKQTNRNFIGIELNQEYVDIANQRLKQETLFKFESKQEVL